MAQMSLLVLILWNRCMHSIIAWVEDYLNFICSALTCKMRLEFRAKGLMAALPILVLNRWAIQYETRQWKHHQKTRDHMPRATLRKLHKLHRLGTLLSVACAQPTTCIENHPTVRCGVTLQTCRIKNGIMVLWGYNDTGLFMRLEIYTVTGYPCESFCFAADIPTTARATEAR